MDQQRKSNWMDEENFSDKNTDVTRSENREGATDADRTQETSNRPMEGGHGHHGGNETGSHQEAQYDKNSDPQKGPGKAGTE